MDGSRASSKSPKRIGTLSVNSTSTTIDLAPSENNLNYDQMFSHAVTAPFSRKGFIPISIDGIPIEALIDTGAEVSCMALSVYNKLNINIALWLIHRHLSMQEAVQWKH